MFGGFIGRLGFGVSSVAGIRFGLPFGVSDSYAMSEGAEQRGGDQQDGCYIR
ncbi:hypothetical protein D9M73_251580 [compost metagenome]